MRKLSAVVLVGVLLLPIGAVADTLVNINTADLATLETLKGIGAVKGQAVIDYRTKNGPFQKIDDIIKVSGIGPVTFNNIRSSITVGEVSVPQAATSSVPNQPTTTITIAPVAVAPTPAPKTPTKSKPIPPTTPRMGTSTKGLVMGAEVAAADQGGSSTALWESVSGLVALVCLGGAAVWFWSPKPIATSAETELAAEEFEIDE